MREEIAAAALLRKMKITSSIILRFAEAASDWQTAQRIMTNAQGDRSFDPLTRGGEAAKNWRNSLRHFTLF